VELDRPPVVGGRIELEQQEEVGTVGQERPPERVSKPGFNAEPSCRVDSFYDHQSP
jgi:hypothetical protein